MCFHYSLTLSHLVLLMGSYLMLTANGICMGNDKIAFEICIIPQNNAGV